MSGTVFLWWLLLSLFLGVSLMGIMRLKPRYIMAFAHAAGGGGGSRGHLPPNPNEAVAYSESDLKDIYLAGGCFWGVEAYLARIHGVAQATSGYANGQTENPTYEDVCHRGSGHAEAVRVRYDPQRLSLEEILKVYFGIIDPTVKNRQGADVGTQYRTGIYYVDEADVAVIQGVVAEEAKKYDRPIVTEVTPLVHFYPAEEHHQEYLEKNPGGYCHVDFSSHPSSQPKGEGEDR